MMKTAIFFLIFGLLSINVRGQFNIGIKAGMNLSTAHFDKNLGIRDQPTNFLGINAGVVSQIGVGKKFLLRSEALYSRKGYSFPANQYGAGGSTVLNYINVPVLFGYRPVSKLSFLAGPEIGFLLKSSQNLPFEKLDYGVSVGSAYFLTKSIGAEIRYTYGLAPLFISDFHDSNNIKTGEIRFGFNRAFQVNVFWFFGKRRPQ